MKSLALYDFLSRRLRIGYAYKILLAAFVGTHVPLLVLIGYTVARVSGDWHTMLPVLGVALVATLAGTGITLYVLFALLRPVLLTSESLRAYAAHRTLPQLPTTHTDEVGTLMADTADALLRLDATMARLEHYDDATGLPRRVLLVKRLQERQAGPAPDGYAMYVLLIRNADRIAAAFGQEVVNTLFRSVAGQVGTAVGAGAQLSRVGSNALAFVQEGVAGAGEAQARVATLMAGLPREYRALGSEVHLALSVGVAMFPADGAQPDELVNSAFTAAASDGAPTAGARDVAVFSAKSRDEVRRRFQLEQDMRRALERGEFSLHYQPVIDLAQGKVVGSEALLRWRHPERGPVSPAEFIPLAEASGLIEPLSRWVLQQACTQLHAWDGTPLERLYVAINLSSGEFLADDQLASIDRALHGHGIAPSRLEVEFTESVAMTDAVRTSRTIAALRDMGVRAAIDDFGTGYSSMAYLQTLPVSKLKIDRAFVSGVQGSSANAAICKALVELARGLGMTVVAEGAETEAEVDFLKKLGCNVFQGYYFGRPVPAEQLVEMVAAFQPPH